MTDHASFSDNISTSQTESLAFGADFANLPAAFYTRLQPTPLAEPYLVAASQQAASLIGMNPQEFERTAFVQAFVGNQLPASAQPLAAVYSGHQFGIWAGQLGDGRAILLGDIQHQGQRWELQLKGAGPTPYSRMADGRAVLRSSIREFLCSEAMAGLSIPTSRALSLIGSSQYVMREQPESTAVVTRMAQSFVRFGSFEHWYYRKQHDHLKTLADYVLANFYPELQAAPKPYQALLQEVTRRTAELVAQWQAVGFMHGVLNTDNMSILGITLDYGPFGFMESFNPRHICNHTDQQGRYSYAMQPQIGYWNCCALAQAMLPLIGEVELTQAAIAGYQDIYLNKINQLWHTKLGLQENLPGDEDFIQALLNLMQENSVDFTLFFRRLGDLKINDSQFDAPLRDLFMNPAAFDGWAGTYRQRLQQENSQDSARQITMHAVNPKYVLRNYLAQVAIEKAQAGDFSEVQHLLKLLERPFDEQAEQQHYAQLPPDWASHLEVSCSS
jgi:serine/tyrosine/threonine adenylyltransferase